ncbi:Na(+)/H(+) antiporter NhaB [Escherichia fergusonii]|uniref:Na(+)/H(+) antiporter NhaB n=1 Tax=Escherichia fergusonii (strain ATCC 35469 / DSM 13698 / CCUG 18766 / IAM 14443 / JCM 21226 / LMG 7866 / NBRC 102419 / NCTC 12128 / CDC 0568-73) TaxID=585054 RepID=NHAB_ESCF3|nr:Na(+)/H(+) antiporter NhaB [Escherichia fergusonii]B7LSJ8.1 RecName: Full=Na(+)/H(+) antiporter NhaB; AltName: Full=Sodium/proton antiporter NhaB [Escherichia fergusonii ATCC 35469]EFL4496242.1 Na(+)/H(+) antiporter NhaB [Escherichia fergusonii]EHT2453877.1 Na(+)/H(+) antiporter NhaB [Escherichia fergusonii]EIH2134978.1 Na(+)/H(+) antiporter NhaB [Escherichia fergusonii]EIH2154523.1 Na(+)/H(+) antiporter NhaB [Escherichia fergusonii]EIH9410034.1 Na(+)/H(+) antiporter NhaB [Escherichia ferg
MEISWGRALWRNFLGQSPDWYKLALLIFLIINPLIFLVNPFIAGWLLVAEFIFTLAMALKCYPLLPGGLLAIEAVMIGMTSPSHVRAEVAANLEVLLLLMFMVAGIYFMKQLLLFIFTRLLLSIRSKALLSLSFCLAAAFLSAFLDALTVVAVVISVAVGFYGIYHRVASSRGEDNDILDDSHIDQHFKVILEQFRGFLRSLMMHAGVGTALGGVMTMVGEPQNLIIAKAAGWSFGDFFLRMSPITVPVLVCGLLTCLLVERMGWFGYGEKLPEKVRQVLQQYDDQSRLQRTRQDKVRLIVQALIGIWLVIALALHLAEVGLIGLSVIIMATSLTGVTDEHAIGKAFTESLPFTALLTVFFSIVAVIIDQSLFSPIIHFVLQASEHAQLTLFYLFNGLLSSISDNVFVGTIYINEAKAAMENGTISLNQFELLAAAINTGTNLPSVATPNGQAAFLFLLTSALAPLIRLSYGRMVWMALPYTIVLTCVGLLCVEFTLAPMTEWMTQQGWLATLS